MRFVTDENFNNQILRGLLHLYLDIVRLRVAASNAEEWKDKVTYIPLR